MEMSDYLEGKVAKWLADQAAMGASPANTYLALFTAAPSDAGGGTEVAGGGYARQTVTWGAESGGALTNSVAVEFPEAKADWGTITHIALFDAIAGGNLLLWTPLDASVVVTTGETARFPIGALDVLFQ